MPLAFIATIVDQRRSSIMSDTVYTRSGVRLRKHSETEGNLNWLFLPGGPGIGSESLVELADCLDVPGSIWLVDLPGDGSNRQAPGAPADPFSCWPHAVVEAAQALPNVVFAGHSTGGMYLLATPELEEHIVGMVLLDTAPDASWHPRFVEMTMAHPLPEVTAATLIYEADRRDENIAAIAVASTEWNFAPAGLARGRDLLSRMPYNSAAVDWSEDNFDHVYAARWWPRTIPTLVIAGGDDRIVWQGGWDAERFRTPNVAYVTVEGGGHFPWIENPSAVRDTFGKFGRSVLAFVQA
ncbi:alpha/beta fold hydrolase [Caenibius tardaugens]|jgi:pimeloyl-ACP methyl ester carboxylesterase|nr:alpha/beta hydrolase [Caenibius tardaugens]